MNILIAEDHPINLKLLRITLEDAGHHVLEAKNGADAMTTLAHEPVDAIISDILMPKMDGYRLCFEVRSHPEWRRLPFIFYTATYLSPSDEKLCYDLGADDFLRKPAAPAAIASALDAALRKTVRASPKPALMNQTVVLKEYSERLVNKLEQKNAELAATVERLQSSEERLQAIVRTEPECVKIVSPEGRLLEMNPAGLAMLEADSLSQVSEGRLLDFIVPDHRAAFGQLHLRVMSGGSGILEFEIVGLKGTRRWLETHAAPLRDKQGKVSSLR